LAVPVEQFVAQATGGPFFLYLHTMEPHDVYATPAEFIERVGWVNVDTRSAIEQSQRDLNHWRQIDYIKRLPFGTVDNSAEIQNKAMSVLDEVQDSFSLLYDAAVISADKNLADVINVLKKHGVWERPWWLVAWHICL